jgi:hypothetical protein
MEFRYRNQEPKKLDANTPGQEPWDSNMLSYCLEHGINDRPANTTLEAVLKSLIFIRLAHKPSGFDEASQLSGMYLLLKGAKIGASKKDMQNSIKYSGDNHFIK